MVVTSEALETLETNTGNAIHRAMSIMPIVCVVRSSRYFYFLFVFLFVFVFVFLIHFLFIVIFKLIQANNQRHVSLAKNLTSKNRKLSISMQHAEQSSINSVNHVRDMQQNEGTLGRQRGRNVATARFTRSP